MADKKSVMGKAVGKGEAEQGAETPKAFGSVEAGTAERMHDGREGSDQVRVVRQMERW